MTYALILAILSSNPIEWISFNFRFVMNCLRVVFYYNENYKRTQSHWLVALVATPILTICLTRFLFVTTLRVKLSHLPMAFECSNDSCTAVMRSTVLSWLDLRLVWTATHCITSKRPTGYENKRPQVLFLKKTVLTFRFILFSVSLSFIFFSLHKSPSNLCSLAFMFLFFFVHRSLCSYFNYIVAPELSAFEERFYEAFCSVQEMLEKECTRFPYFSRFVNVLRCCGYRFSGGILLANSIWFLFIWIKTRTNRKT